MSIPRGQVNERPRLYSVLFSVRLDRTYKFAPCWLGDKETAGVLDKNGLRATARFCGGQVYVI
jgi:hypothetical protein